VSSPRTQPTSQDRRRSGQHQASLSQNISSWNVSEASEELHPASLSYELDLEEPRPLLSTNPDASTSVEISSPDHSSLLQPPYSDSQYSMGASESYSHTPLYGVSSQQTQSYSHGRPGLDTSIPEQGNTNYGIERIGDTSVSRRADQRAADIAPSTPRSFGEWKLHERYKRYYKDYEQDGES
jgi:hypothetical protein